MISVEQCRALLSTEIELTDNELEGLRNDLYSTAKLAFESYWFDSNSGSKNPVGLLDGSRSTDTV
jgi:hypothetical protein